MRGRPRMHRSGYPNMKFEMSQSDPIGSSPNKPIDLTTPPPAPPAPAALAKVNALLKKVNKAMKVLDSVCDKLEDMKANFEDGTWVEVPPEEEEE
ncbi:hypothetical protein VTN96DRAFT_9808 [Rasamsonia emersonii]